MRTLFKLTNKPTYYGTLRNTQEHSGTLRNTQEHSGTNKNLKLLLLTLALLCFNQLVAQEGREHTLVVCDDGLVKSFGYNTSCQIGTGNNATTSYTTPYSISSTYVLGAVSVAVGDAHSLALLDNGDVKAWGSNVAGCAGKSYPTNLIVCEPYTIDLPGCAVAVAAGESFSMALLSDGTIYTWGRNNYGQLGNGINTTDTHVPDDVAGITTAVAISAGGAHAMALLADGTVVTWGYGSEGQMGDNSTTATNVTASAVTIPTGMSDVVALDAGGDHCIVLTDDNQVYSWGRINPVSLAWLRQTRANSYPHYLRSFPVALI